MSHDVHTVAAAIVGHFERIVRRDGGRLALLSAEEDLIRVGYRPGDAAMTCSNGVCLLPREELEQLMAETIARRAPGTQIRVEMLA